MESIETRISGSKSHIIVELDFPITPIFDYLGRKNQLDNIDTIKKKEDRKTKMVFSGKKKAKKVLKCLSFYENLRLLGDVKLVY